MFTYLLFGASYAFAAAVQPGPLQAFLVGRAVSQGWRRTLPAAVAPLISDGPIAVVVLLLLSRVPPSFTSVLRLVGGAFLLFLAAGAYRSWRRYVGPLAGEAGSGQRTMLQAVVVNLLNPNPYLGWSLVMGPLLLKGWREAPAHGVALVAGFYGTMAVSLAGIIVLFAAARELGPRVGRGLVGVSAVALAVFGVYQLWVGGWELIGG